MRKYYKKLNNSVSTCVFTAITSSAYAEVYCLQCVLMQATFIYTDKNWVPGNQSF